LRILVVRGGKIAHSLRRYVTCKSEPAVYSAMVPCSGAKIESLARDFFPVPNQPHSSDSGFTSLGSLGHPDMLLEVSDGVAE